MSNEKKKSSSEHQLEMIRSVDNNYLRTVIIILFSLTGIMVGLTWFAQHIIFTIISLGLILLIILSVAFFRYLEYLEKKATKASVIIGESSEITNKANAYIVQHHEKLRQKMFLELNDRDRVERSLHVYGVGLTNLTSDLAFISDLLEKRADVYLCMIDPEVLRSNLCYSNSCPIDFNDIERTIELIKGNSGESPADLVKQFNLLIWEQHFNGYYILDKYGEEIRISHERISNFIRTAPKKSENYGGIELRTIKSLVPVSINIVDKDRNNSSFIFESNLPFTQHRILMRHEKKQAASFYNRMTFFFDKLWEEAEAICKNG